MGFLASILVGILAGYLASRIRGKENKGCLLTSSLALLVA